MADGMRDHATLALLAARPTPLPRRNRLRIGPQATVSGARLVLQPVQRVVSDVPIKHPRHAGAHLGGVGVGAAAGDMCHRSAVAIEAAVRGDGSNLGASIEAQRSQCPLGALAEWLAVFRRVDLG